VFSKESCDTTQQKVKEPKNKSQTNQKGEKMKNYVNKKALNFINDLSGVLRIEWNKYVDDLPAIKSIELEFEKTKNDDFVPLSDKEMNMVIFKTDCIKMRTSLWVNEKREYSNNFISHLSNKNFTIGDIIKCIEKTELYMRPNTYWFGGPDVHHVFFEGIEQDKEGIWNINWGS
jgi:hypothetical protein